MAGDWRLSADFGASFTEAAVSSGNQVTTLLLPDGALLTSMVALNAGNRFLTGRQAVKFAEVNPTSAVRQPKRALIASQKMRLEGRTVLTADVVAAVLEYVYSTALAMHGGVQPRQVFLSHPADWTDGELETFRAAASVAGIRQPNLVSEPVVAATHYTMACPAPDCVNAGRTKLKANDYILVHDFGMGTCVTVLRRDQSGLSVVGKPVCQPDLGGEELDERLLNLVVDRVSESRPELWAAFEEAGEAPSSAMARLAEEIAPARQRLSMARNTDVLIPGTTIAIRVTRSEFESAIEPEMSQTIALVERALLAAGICAADLTAIVLAGGANRTPRVSDVLAQRFVLPLTAPDTKSVVAHGALLTLASARREIGRSTYIDPANSNWLNDL